MEIKQTDLTGEPVNVCTQYEPHTISLVKGPALGINIVKVKNEHDIDTEEMKILKDKIDKAKSLDIKEGEEVSAEDVVEKSKSSDKLTATDELTSVDNGFTGGAPVEQVLKTKSESRADDEHIEKQKSSDEIVESSISEEPVQIDTISSQGDTPSEKVEKVKTFSVEELGNSMKLAFDTITRVSKEILEKHPDSSIYEVNELLYSALCKSEDALYDEKYFEENKIFQEVWDEIEKRTSKSKSLKVKESTDPIDALKAFSEVNPEMAVLLQEQINTSKAKAEKAEAEKEAIIRSKALAKGVETYKRIATDDNSTDDIVDALSLIETLAPEAHKVVSKALQVASTITMAGELFADTGSSEAIQHISEAEYVEQKAKSLIEEAQKAGNTMNSAVARATIRGSEEFTALYR